MFAGVCTLSLFGFFMVAILPDRFWWTGTSALRLCFAGEAASVPKPVGLGLGTAGRAPAYSTSGIKRVEQRAYRNPLGWVSVRADALLDP
jgi:hypothetical protein